MALSPQQIAQYAYRAGFRGADLVKAVAIALAESGGNPAAYNPELAAGTRKNSGSRGLWQIYGQAHPEFDNSTMFDPQANADAAYKVYREQGGRFTPWSTWNQGMASKIIPTLPKFKIDASPAARSQSTTRDVSKMAGTTTQGGVIQSASPVSAIGSSGSVSEPGAIDKIVTGVKNSILGKTAEGEQREGADLAAFVVGLVLVLVGLIFLFVNSGTSKAVIAAGGKVVSKVL